MAVPLPRYQTAKCCDSRQHITNFGTPDFDMSVKLARRRSEVALMGLGNDNAETGHYEILDVAEELGGELQFAPDGVHLTDATYSKVADLLVKKAGGESGRAGGAAARARAHSIITEPTAAVIRETVSATPAPITDTGLDPGGGRQGQLVRQRQPPSRRTFQQRRPGIPPL